MKIHPYVPKTSELQPMRKHSQSLRMDADFITNQALKSSVVSETSSLGNSLVKAKTMRVPVKSQKESTYGFKKMPKSSMTVTDPVGLQKKVNKTSEKPLKSEIKRISQFLRDTKH